MTEARASATYLALRQSVRSHAFVKHTMHLRWAMAHSPVNYSCDLSSWYVAKTGQQSGFCSGLPQYKPHRQKSMKAPLILAEVA